MERKDIFKYVKNQFGTEPDYPWNDWNAVLRHNNSKKWYGLILEVDRKKLDSKYESMIVDVLNVKCDPTLIGSLLMQPGFYPAYHMNKELWISICLNSNVSDDEIKKLLDMSYVLTKQKKGC